MQQSLQLIKSQYNESKGLETSDVRAITEWLKVITSHWSVIWSPSKLKKQSFNVNSMFITEPSQIDENVSKRSERLNKCWNWGPYVVHLKGLQRQSCIHCCTSKFHQCCSCTCMTWRTRRCTMAYQCSRLLPCVCIDLWAAAHLQCTDHYPSYM